MNFFLDENFPRPAVVYLQQAGHSARHALEIFPPVVSDERLFAHAQKQHAIFISTDRDFFHTVPLAYEQHHGAMVITLRRANRADLLRRLDDALTALGMPKPGQHGVAYYGKPHLQPPAFGVGAAPGQFSL